MNDFAQTRNGQIFLANVARIAVALEKLAAAAGRIADQAADQTAQTTTTPTKGAE